MKFINNIKNKSIAVLLCTAMVFSVSGCGTDQVNIPDSYKINSDIFGLLHEESEEISGNHLMGTKYCVVNDNIELAEVDMSLAESAGVFNITNRETVYAKNVHMQLYPASTTKILTAYLTLKHGNLDDIVTVSSEHVKLEKDSSNCGLKAGDQISVKDLLYGLMLKSANEAANVLADYISGSTTSFAILMNEEAAALQKKYAEAFTKIVNG